MALHIKLPWAGAQSKSLAKTPRYSGVSGLPVFDESGDVADGQIGQIASATQARSGFWGGIKAAFGRPDQQLSLISPWLSGVQWTISRAFVALSHEAYGGNSVVYACLRLLSSALMEPPLVPYGVNAQHVKDELDYNHPLYKLLRAPNELMTTNEFVELCVLHMGLAGRCHWWKERDNIGRVIALWPLRPDRVGPLYAQQPANPYGGATPYGDNVRNPQQAYTTVGSATPLPQTNNVLAGWNYWPPGWGMPMQIAAGDVMTINLPDPAGESGGVVEGLGPVQVLAREVESDNEATSLIAALLKNHAMPGAILSVKANVMRDKVAQFKREFKKAFGGSNRGDIAIFDGDTAFQQVGFNMQELEFPNLRRLAETRIAASFGVPPVLVGLMTGVESANRSTLAEFRKFLAQTTCTTWWRRIQAAVTRDLASEFGGEFVIEFDLSHVKALTEQARLEIQPFEQAAVAGAITIDEYRSNVLGLDPLPGGIGNSLILKTESRLVPAGVDESLMGRTVQGTDEQASGDPSPVTSAASALANHRWSNRPPKAKIVKISEVRKHIGDRGKPWIPDMTWRSPQYVSEDAELSASTTAISG